MFSVVGMIFLIILVLLAVMLGLVIYYFAYMRVINRQLYDTSPHKRMPEMPKIVTRTILITFVAILGMMLIVFAMTSRTDKTTPVHVRDEYAIIDVKNRTYNGYAGSAQLDDASFIEQYSQESNEGYQKKIVHDGDYTFTIFTTKTPQDSFHPDFLCYVSYSGKAYNSMYIGGFFSNDIEDCHGGGSSIGEPVEELLFIGNLDTDCTFSIEVGGLSEKGEADYIDQSYGDVKAEIRDYAENMGTVSFSLYS